jgi:hypothetical protein
MKKLAISTISLLLLTGIAAPMVTAQEEEMMEFENPTITPDDAETRTDAVNEGYDARTVNYDDIYNSMYDVRRTEAFSLVTSAYRGEYEDYGIPSYAELANEYQSGEITAEDVIKAAIEANQLSPRAMEDEGYVNAVELQLDSLQSR